MINGRESAVLMNDQMLLQIGLFGKAMITDRTTVRPRAIVGVHVTTEIAGRGETLGTLRTLMWFRLIREEQQ